MAEIKLKEFLVEYGTPMAENSANGRKVVQAVNWRVAARQFESDHPHREIRQVWESRAIGRTTTTRKTTITPA